MECSHTLDHPQHSPAARTHTYYIPVHQSPVRALTFIRRVVTMRGGISLVDEKKDPSTELPAKYIPDRSPDNDTASPSPTISPTIPVRESRLHAYCISVPQQSFIVNKFQRPVLKYAPHPFPLPLHTLKYRKERMRSAGTGMRVPVLRARGARGWKSRGTGRW